MKRNISWIAALLLSWSASSQTLKPVLRLENKDTLVCFTINQSRSIANYITDGLACDSVNVEQERLISTMGKEISLKDSAFYYSMQRNFALQEQLNNTQQITAELNASVARYKKRFTALIVQRAALVICSVALSTALIIKK